MTTALIAEDEPMMRAQLKGRLAQAWPELQIVAEAGNGEEALALADEKRPDIAFLDIRMPVLSGLDVARELAGRCHIVFVTAYDDYAVAASTRARSTASWPPMPERIAKVVARLRRVSRMSRSTSRLYSRSSPRTNRRPARSNGSGFPWRR
jgi:DNA-binding LytR/AlgR family response regulator